MNLSDVLTRIVPLIDVTPSGCWQIAGEPYPTARVQDTTVSVHRLLYALTVGPVPAGKVLDHRCHWHDPDCNGGDACQHRRCVRPDHLRPVTPSVNSRGAAKTRRDRHDRSAAAVPFALTADEWIATVDLADALGRTTSTYGQREQAALRVGRELCTRYGIRTVLRRAAGLRLNGFWIADLDRVAPDLADVARRARAAAQTART